MGDSKIEDETEDSMRVRTGDSRRTRTSMLGVDAHGWVNMEAIVFCRLG